MNKQPVLNVCTAVFAAGAAAAYLAEHSLFGLVLVLFAIKEGLTWNQPKGEVNALFAKLCLALVAFGLFFFFAGPALGTGFTLESTAVVLMALTCLTAVLARWPKPAPKQPPKDPQP